MAENLFKIIISNPSNANHNNTQEKLHINSC
jgi:hypothetical protein